MICIWSSWYHCHLIIYCFIKFQIGFIFLVPAYPGCPNEHIKSALRRRQRLLLLLPPIPLLLFLLLLSVLIFRNNFRLGRVSRNGIFGIWGAGFCGPDALQQTASKRQRKLKPPTAVTKTHPLTSSSLIRICRLLCRGEVKLRARWLPDASAYFLLGWMRQRLVHSWLFDYDVARCTDATAERRRCCARRLRVSP